jgi:hypothetical protein
MHRPQSGRALLKALNSKVRGATLFGAGFSGEKRDFDRFNSVFKCPPTG